MITINETTGLLTITGTSLVDTLILSESAGILTISDSTQTLVASGGANQFNPNTVTIPVAALTEPVVVDLADGDDSILATTVTVPVVFTGGSGADTMTGGVRSTLSYASASVGVNVNLGIPSFNNGDATGDVVTGIGNVIGSEQADTLIGDGDKNYLIGLGGNDIIDGGAGNDNIQGGAGADNLDGGDGFDTLSYKKSTAGVTIDLSLNSFLGGDAAGDTIANFETISGSDLADSLTGDSQVNSFRGQGGNDTLSGGAGNDRLFGGAGNDILNGGADKDRLNGDADNDTLNGDGGNDILNGGDGDDILNGGDGNDTLRGNAGADSYDGGAGKDTVNFSDATSRVKLSLFTGTITAGDDAGGTIVNVETIFGSDFNDNFSGDGQANTFHGGDGKDNLGGSGGDDLLRGGDGDDRLLGGNGNDRLYGENDNDTLLGKNNNDQLFGGAGNDQLFGDAGKDRLSGGNDNDTLTGGADADILTGGSGNDSFVFTALTDSLLGSRDKITDLVIGTDAIVGPKAVSSEKIDQFGSIANLGESSIQALLTTTSFEMDTAATFSVGSRHYLAINDSVDGFSATADAIVEITGYTGNTLDALSISAL
ncbi:MAG: calcium-binding protein [Cyanobacteria bacterium J06560_5]